jgi:predicted unusual protein kinase regulating ubiquinone biosynthesis (AarF/ABC1/UbiB family)
VGRVPDELRGALRETVVGVGTRDASRLIKSYMSLGFILPGADTDALEKASTMVFARFWGLSMNEIRSVSIGEFHDIGHRVRDVMVEMPFQVPNDLLMLVRCVAILSGMCTGLDPNFNLWLSLEPYAKKLVAEEAGSLFDLDNLLDQLGGIVTSLAALPSQASRVLSQMESGGLMIQSPQVTSEVRVLSRSVDRLTGGVVFAALLIGGVTLLNAGNATIGNVLLGASGATLLWVLFAGRGKV